MSLLLGLGLATACEKADVNQRQIMGKPKKSSQGKDLQGESGRGDKAGTAPADETPPVSTLTWDGKSFQGNDTLQFLIVE